MRKLTALIVFSLLAFSTFVASAPGSSGTAGSVTRADVARRVRPGVSAPARTLPAVRSPRYGDSEGAPEVPEVPRPTGDPAPTAGPIQRAMAPRTPSVSSFEGQGFTGTRPPYPTGEVDDQWFVQGVATSGGTSVAIYDKSTSVLMAGPFSIAGLWGLGDACHDRAWGQANIHYDQFADRWVLAQNAGTVSPPYNFAYCVAVSQTPDPAGSYYTYTFDTGNRYPDYPRMGVWADGYYVTSNDFMDLATYDGPSVWVFHREAMLEGEVASYQRFDLTDTYYDLLVADVDGPQLPFYYNEPVVSLDEASDQLYLWDVMINWVNPAESALSGPVAYPVDPYTSAFCANDRQCLGQPGTALTLDSLSRHVMFRLAYRNLGGTEMMSVGHAVDADATKTKLRWYVLERNVGEATWSLEDQGTFGPDATNRWTPSVAIDGSGGLGIAYNVVDPVDTYPSIAVSGRNYIDAHGSLGVGEAVTAVGVSSSTLPNATLAARWGGSNHASADPTDPCKLWYTAEYMGASSQWATQIGSFSLPGCGTKNDSTVSLAVWGQYGTKGASLLFHPKSKIKFTISVDSGAPGQLAGIYVERWNKAATLWEPKWSSLANLSSVTSSISGSFKGSVLGKGKYRLYGHYPGDADSDPADSPYVMIRVTKT